MAENLLASWHPEPLDYENDAKQLDALHKAFKAEWDSHEGDIIKQLDATLKWIPLVFALLKTTTKYPAANLAALADTLLGVVLSAELNTPALVRTSKLLARVLQRLRYVKGVQQRLTVPWRPLRALLRRQLFARTRTYESPMMLQQVVGDALTKLVRKLRRYFPAGSAAEIWAEFEPQLRNPLRPHAFMALGELALFMPASAAAKGDGAWGAWAPAWLEVWSTVAHCDFWDRHWMALFARLAKHDTRSLVDWGPLMPQLFTHIMWAFHLPVGSATAAPPFGRKAPEAAVWAFHSSSAGVATSAGQVVVYLLGRATVPASSAAAGTATAERPAAARQTVEVGQQEAAGAEEDAALAHLRTAATLLEQYYHPSNSGSWTAALTTFLNQLSGHLSRRTCREAEVAAKRAAGTPNAADADMDDAAAAAADEEAESEAAGADGAVVMEEAAAVDDAESDASGDDADIGGPELLPAVRDAVAHIIVRLAASAQSSKDGTTVTIACYTLRRMAYLAPQTVLPLVCQRFEAALEAVTASQQLVPAILALSMVTRPLLAFGLPPPEGEAMELDTAADAAAVKAEARERAAHLVAGAMQALLPAIDANDEAKTLSCFRFFCVVLSSIPALEEDGSGTPSALPLAAEEWADELLSRVFAVLTNLDPPVEHRGADAGSGSPLRGNSFLMASEQSMFRPTMHLLFARMAPGMRKRAMMRLARFVTGSTLPSTLTEAGLLVNAAAAADPDVAASVLAEALLATLEQELASLGTSQPSTAQESAMTYTMGLLTAAIMPLGAAVLPLAPRVRAAINSAFAVFNSRLVLVYAGRLLCGCLQTLAGWYPTDQFAPTSQPGQLERFVDKREAAGSLQAPQYHKATDAELDLASSLLEEHLAAAATGLAAAAADPATAAAWLERRQAVRSLAWRLEGAISGLRTCFADHEADGTSGDSVAITGRAGPQLGSVAMRVAATEAVTAALQVVPEQDSETFAVLLHLAELLLQPGGQQLAEYGYLDRMWAADQEIVREPGEARLLADDDEAAGTRWRMRRPRWLLVERIGLDAQWRDSQRAYRPWASTQQATPSFQAVPAPVKALASELLRLSMSVYKHVRDNSRNVLERALKRYTALAPAALPPVLLAIAGMLSEASGATPATNGAASGTNGQKPAVPAGSELALTEGGVTDALLQRLLQRMHAAEVDLKDDAAAEAKVAGGANIMLQKAVWRVCCHDATSAAAAAAALVAGTRLGGPRVVASITGLSLYSGIRSFGVPAVRAAQAGLAPVPPATAALLRELLLLSAPPSPQRPPLHWRRSLIATAQLLLLTPPPDAEVTGQLVGNLAAAAAGELSGMRALAGGGLVALLPVLPAGKHQLDVRGQAAVKAAREALAAPGWGDALLNQLAHTHPATSTGESMKNRMVAMQALSQDEQAARALGLSFLRAHNWPFRSSTDGHAEFLAANARLVKALALAAPAEALAAMRPWIERALSRPQDVDRPATFAAAEALSGLLAAGAPFEDGGAAWSEWFGPLLTAAVEAAPLDMVDDWSQALRFGANSLAAAPAGLPQLLALVGGMLSADAASVLVIKQLHCLRACLLELSASGLLFPTVAHSTQASSSSSPAAAAATDGSTAQAADSGGGGGGGGGVVSSGSGSGSGSAISSLLTGGGSYDDDGPPPEANVAAASSFLDAVLTALPALARVKTQTVQEEAARLAVAACGVALGADVGGAAAAHVDKLCSWTLSVLQESAVAVQAAAGAAPEASGSNMQQNGSMPHADKAQVAATQHLGFALQFAIEALRFGEGPVLATRLAPMLPPLLQLQELKLPALQRLEVPAKTALALLKYLPLPASLAADVAASLQGGRGANLWTARAAALVFAQYFWFRHVFLLSPDTCAALQAMAEGMLGDGKLEVAGVAAATLSGMLKAAAPAEAAAARARFLDAATAATSSQKQARRRGASSADLAAAGHGLHASVLGLRAAALTAPYDVPDWLPDVLSALAAAASAPAPTGKAARAALSDFRRTHEPAALAEARAALGPDRWEAVVEFEGGREGGFA